MPSMPMNNKPATSSRRRFLQQTAGTGGLLAASGLLGNKLLAQSSNPQEPGIQSYVAPELEVDYWIDANGEPTTFSIEESKGKWVLLKCFQNWCPGCHKHGFPMLQKFSERFHDHPEVAIAAIQTVFEGHNSNTQDAVRELQLRYDLPITMGHDAGNPETHSLPSTMANYRTGGTPWIILISPSGAVIYNHFHVRPEDIINHVAEHVA